MLRTWIVREVGVAAAAVVDALDFLDRREDRAGQYVATRTRIISDLQGVVSRQSVDGALRQLVEFGWVERREVTAPGQRNIQTTHHYSLNSDAINAWISRSSKNGTPDGAKMHVAVVFDAAGAVSAQYQVIPPIAPVGNGALRVDLPLPPFGNWVPGVSAITP